MLDPVMLEVKKLRTLQRKGTEMDKNKVVEKTRKYLVTPSDLSLSPCHRSPATVPLATVPLPLCPCPCAPATVPLALSPCDNLAEIFSDWSGRQ